MPQSIRDLKRVRPTVYLILKREGKHLTKVLCQTTVLSEFVRQWECWKHEKGVYKTRRNSRAEASAGHIEDESLEDKKFRKAVQAARAREYRKQKEREMRG